MKTFFEFLKEQAMKTITLKKEKTEVVLVYYVL